MSQSTGLNITQIIQPLIISAVLKGKDISPMIDALVNAQINDLIINQVLQSINIPQEFQPIIDVLRLATQLDTLKAVMAAAKGQEYSPKFGPDKVIEVAVSLQLVSALSGALSGSGGSGSSSGSSGGTSSGTKG